MGKKIVANTLTWGLLVSDNTGTRNKTKQKKTKPLRTNIV